MRHLRRFIVVFAFAACIQPALAGAASGRILMPKKAEVRGPVITLGEIAQFKGIPAAEQKILGDKSLGAAAPPGKSVTLTNSQLKGRLYGSGMKLDRYTLDLPDKMTITTRAEIISGDRIMQAAADAVSEKLDAVWTGSPARVEIVDTPPNVILAVGEAKLKAVMESRANRFGPTKVRVDIRQGNRTVRQLDVSGYMKVYVTVVAASHDMPRGAVLTADDLKPVEVELAALRPGAMASADQAVGKRVARSLREGDALLDTSIEILPDINSGEMVQLVVKGKGFEIAMQVKALEKGRRGDIIRVLNVKSRKVLDARVVDSGSVELVNQ